MQCCLWLNGKKVYKADEIAANFDLGALEGYLCGGSLIRWLNAHGGEDIAARLDGITPHCDLSFELKRAFGIIAETAENNPQNITEENAFAANSRDTLPCAPTTSFNAFGSGFSLSSFLNIPQSQLNSAGSGFMLLGSLSSLVSEILSEFGTSTADIGSFAGMGSFFPLSGINAPIGSRSGSYDISGFISAADIINTAAASYNDAELTPEEADILRKKQLEKLLDCYATEEYKQLHLNLSSDPLNMYGYGIHLV